MKKKKLPKYQLGTQGGGELDQQQLQQLIAQLSSRLNKPNNDLLTKSTGNEKLLGNASTQGYGTPEYALAQGFHQDPDGQYRKLQYTTNPNQLDYSSGFKALNTAANATTAIANTLNTQKQDKQDFQKYLKAAYGQGQENQNQFGLNTPPAYFRNGGGLTADKAKEILRDGTAQGHALTDKQRKYFGWIAGGGKGQYGGKYQMGGSNLFNTNKQQYVDSILNQHKDLNWVQRLYGNNQQTVQIPGEPYPSTHFMADNGEGYVYPRVQMVNGKLVDLGGKAEDYSRENNTGIQLPKEQGTWFAANGYKEGTGVLPSAHYKTPKQDLPTKQTGGGVTNQTRTDWNSYVDWLAQQGVKGSAKLDTDSTGFKMLDQYIKANPNTSLTKDSVLPIQQDLSKYRDWALNNIKTNKGSFTEGTDENNFMSGLSKLDGYPGQKTTSYKFPNEYLKTFENGKLVKDQNLGYATVKQYGGMRKYQAGGKNEWGQPMDLTKFLNPKDIDPKNSNFKLFKSLNTQDTSFTDNANNALQTLIDNIQKGDTSAAPYGILLQQYLNYQAGAPNMDSDLAPDDFKPDFYKTGGSTININPAHKGEFTAYAKKKRMSVSKAAHWVLAHSDNTKLRKQANFALNAKKFKHQTGGLSMDGYLANSADRNNAYNIIPSNMITMDGVPHDVMAIPDNDQPMLMKKNSGKYNFKNSQYVTEIPMKQDGGEVPEQQGVPAPMANAELEQGEVFQNQQGNINKVAETEPTHEDGGSMQANVHKVLEDTSDKRKDDDSKALAVNPALAEQLVGFKPKRNISHSKLYEQAIEFYAKKAKKFETGIRRTMDDIDDNGGGKYANNTLEENAKNMEKLPTKQELFDIIYHHQELIKQMNGIDNNTQSNKYGGKPKYQAGGNLIGQITDPYYKPLPDPNNLTPLNSDLYQDNGQPYAQNVQDVRNDISGYTALPTGQFKNYYDKSSKTQYTAPAGLTPAQFYTPDVVAQMATLNDKTGIDNDLGVAQDNTWGWRHQYIYDNYVLPKLGGNLVGNGFSNLKTSTPTTVAAPTNNLIYKKPTTPTPSQFNEPLRWYDVASDTYKYLDATSRDYMPLEQLSRQPLKVHEMNVAPQMQQNQQDFNALVANNAGDGVGASNASNYAALKYSANNTTLGNAENLNNQSKDTVDKTNNDNQYNLDVANMGLRDQFNQRVLQSKNAQRTAKYNALNNLFTKVALNRKLNREGNLEMQLFPYFNQYGQFNGNQIQLPITATINASQVTDKSSIVTEPDGKKYYYAKDPNGDMKRYLVKQ